MFSLEALTLGQVTHVLEAAVQVVGAADGLGEDEVFGISSLWCREQPG